MTLSEILAQLIPASVAAFLLYRLLKGTSPGRFINRALLWLPVFPLLAVAAIVELFRTQGQQPAWMLLLFAAVFVCTQKGREAAREGGRRLWDGLRTLLSKTFDVLIEVLPIVWKLAVFLGGLWVLVAIVKWMWMHS